MSLERLAKPLVPPTGPHRLGERSGATSLQAITPVPYRAAVNVVGGVHARKSRQGSHSTTQLPLRRGKARVYRIVLSPLSTHQPRVDSADEQGVMRSSVKSGNAMNQDWLVSLSLFAEHFTLTAPRSTEDGSGLELEVHKLVRCFAHRRSRVPREED